MTEVFDVLTMGRISVDLYPHDIGVSLRDVTTFGKFLGGTATNVAVAAARYGRRAAVITRTGDDPFGEFLHDVRLTVVLVQNHGFASIGELSETVGAQRFGTASRYRSDRGRLDGDVLPVDLAANAASLGVQVHRATTISELRAALHAAKGATGPALVHVETDPLVPAPSSESWWDVPVAEVSALGSTAQARKVYEAGKDRQRAFPGGQST
jgi:sugar/nucleoside kinase (ribokinase family)